MSLKLMYITNNPEVARIAEDVGVDRVFVDLEYIGKAERQGGMDTVQSDHTLQDVKVMSEILTKAELLVRVNPIHDATEDYCSSEEEIETAVVNGADIIMLPFFKTVQEVEYFLSCVNGRCRTMLLLETPEAVDVLDEILELKGIDEIHIGLNDLSLGYKKRFMFELLADGTEDPLVEKISKRNIFYGFGGMASLGKGMLPGNMVLKEHYRLKSGMVILSRSFCNISKVTDISEVKNIFEKGVLAIRNYEKECERATDFIENRQAVKETVAKIVNEL